jgi:hypothetical protein
MGNLERTQLRQHVAAYSFVMAGDFGGGGYCRTGRDQSTRVQFTLRLGNLILAAMMSQTPKNR